MKDKKDLHIAQCLVIGSEFKARLVNICNLHFIFTGKIKETISLSLQRLLSKITKIK